jgi:stage II sporulation protein D
MTREAKGRVGIVLGFSLVLLGLPVALLSCAQRTGVAEEAPGPDGPLIRVGLSATAFQLHAASCTVRDVGTGAVLARGILLKGAAARDGRGIRIGDRRFDTARLRLFSSQGAMTLNGIPYPGEFLFQCGADGRLQALNLVPLERYLAGVLGCEMPLTWPAETLKAQVIAARTYALVCRQRRAAEPFDLTDSTQDQCYQGTLKETPETRRLVKETAGVILTYRHQPFSPYYSAVCGGHTADGPYVLRGEAPLIAPLRGRPCPHCAQGLPEDKQDRFRWRKVLRLADLAKALGIHARLTAIRPVAPDAGGHAGLVHVTWAAKPEGSRDVGMLEFRKASGLTSSAWTARVQGEEVVFEGRGFGHGVGLCQWGAKRMGEIGFDPWEILRFYYPGSDLQRRY